MPRTSGDAAARKRERPDLVIAVGGCYAEAQRERIFERYPFVDVAFGPGSIPHLGDWIAAGGYGGRARPVRHARALRRPTSRCTASGAFQAWVQVSMGCNSTCAYCIVPAVRGREQSRRPGDIVAEVTRPRRATASARSRCSVRTSTRGAATSRPASARSSASCCAPATPSTGIERIRFTSPHPKDFREPVIAAMAECDERLRARPSAAQSGSSRILKAMRRTYTASATSRLVERLRSAIPDLALGTDLIVGFPGRDR